MIGVVRAERALMLSRSVQIAPENSLTHIFDIDGISQKDENCDMRVVSKGFKGSDIFRGSKVSAVFNQDIKIADMF